MRIGEVARTLGISADTVRFYERAGWLPSAPRLDNGYREYGDADVEHLRLLIDLRSLEIPLERAAAVARMCHTGHCTDTTRELPALIARQREEIARRIDRLRSLDARLADLGGHLSAPPGELSVLPTGACCDAAAAVLTVGDGTCACCAVPQQ
jgi:DNA-binding transcriptional MerR regulator